MTALEDLPYQEVHWKRSVRIIPSRFPPVVVFDGVCEPTDLDTVFEVEGLTNARLREMRGETNLLEPEERMRDVGTAPIMAAFTHPHPLGSRFGTSTFGVYEAANDLDTAVAETVRGREKFLRDSRSPPEQLDMRVYYATIRATLCDLRGLEDSIPELRDGVARSPQVQLLGEELRAAGVAGILYDSANRPGGECVSIFAPKVINSCRQGEHLVYVWNGREITEVYIKQGYRPN